MEDASLDVPDTKKETVNKIILTKSIEVYIIVYQLGIYVIINICI